MPRNMSFAITTDQIRSRTKTVTRRIGWLSLKPGDIINACVKCMGLKPGEKIQRLGQIRVVSVRREELSELIHSPVYGDAEASREGFPYMSGAAFVRMFCQHMKATTGTTVTRIEFEYVEGVTL